jgi:gluconate 5-dehydrogenase
MQHRKPIEQFTDAEWQKMMDTNLNSAFYVRARVIPAMKERRSGKIINICSLLSFISRPTIVPYAPPRAGWRCSPRVSRRAGLVQHPGQRIGPGFYKTEMNRRSSRIPSSMHGCASGPPAARWGDPEELAGAAIFLASALELRQRPDHLRRRRLHLVDVGLEVRSRRVTSVAVCNPR